MVIFVDTSAIFALLDKRDKNHEQAARMWEQGLTEETSLVSTNYVLLETITLLQRRLGSKAVRDVAERVVPLLEVEWIDPTMHELALRTVLFAGERGISLVDSASFEAMRKRGIQTVFTFDHHFTEQGFDCLP